jgi:hypothetical protein
MKEFTACVKRWGRILDTHSPDLKIRSLLDLLKRVQQVVQVLEKNTFVEDLTVGRSCLRSTLQLTHFLRTSPSLRRLRCEEKSKTMDEDELKETMKMHLS